MLRLNNYPILSSPNGKIQAYIISLKGNPLSERLTNKCIESLKNVDMPYNIWQAFDGTNGTDIIVPDALKNKEYLSWIKQSKESMTVSEVAVFLSHLSLWAHCCTVNEPIVILEHDAVMVKPYLKHRFPNTISYLGNIHQKPNNNTDPCFYYIKDSYFFIAGAYAYAIDPPMARNLVSHAIRYGITGPADNFMRMDVFSVVQDDFYAHEEGGGGTVVRR